MSDEARFCAVTEAQAAQVSAWSKRSLSWCVADAFPTLPEAEVREAFGAAFESWAAVCGLVFREVQNPDAADVLVTVGKIDGPMGTLAWSELPAGDDRRLTQRYDRGDRYVVAAQPPAQSVDLLAVAAHEIGHALGLDHSGRGTGDLMEPTYRPGRRGPQPGDVHRVQALYGPPRPRPPSGERVATAMVILDQLGQPMARFDIKRTD